MRLRTLALSAVLVAVSATGALAHHSNAMFDRTKTIEVKGTVREFQWTNPHIWIEMDIVGPPGANHYTIEGPTPGILRTRGWKFNSLKAGDEIVAKVHPLRDGTAGGGLMSVTLRGTVLEAGSSNVGVEPPK
jgi:hypothetical protein